MEWAAVIDESIRYMEDHLLTLRSPAEVANHVHLSVIYLQQAFHITTGLSIGEYLRNRKLHLAARDLISTDDKVIDIALKYGYETPESFAKAFSRFHHASPTQVRKCPTLARTFLPINISITIYGGCREDIPSPPAQIPSAIGFSRLNASK